MLYLDSNVFIYPALYEGEKAEGAADLLKNIVAGEEKAATASLTIDEVAWILTKNESREAALKESERLLMLPNLQILDVSGETMASALGHMRKHQSLSPRDAIHLATATDHGIYTIATDDRDFDEVDTVERRDLTEL